MTFDSLAPHYRWMEAVLAGPLLQKARTGHFHRIPPNAKILIVGEGPGRCLEDLIPRHPAAQVDVLEASAAMIAQAKRRLLDLGLSLEHVRFQQADVTTWTGLQSHYDVVITPFVLDCFPEPLLETVVARIASAARADALWLLSDFQVPSAGWRRWRARAVHALMYSFFHYLVGIPATRWASPEPHLLRHGFRLHTRTLRNAGLIRSDLWERVSDGEASARLLNSAERIVSSDQNPPRR